MYLREIFSQVRGIPKFKTKLCDISANEGELNVEFVVEVEGFPKPSVHWFLGDVEITEKRTEYTRVEEGDNYKLVIKEVKTELRGSYTCKVQNEYGESASSSNLTVNTRPKLLKKLADQRMKEGDTLKLSFEVSGTPDPEVKWYKDGEEVTADARIKITRDSQRQESYDLTVTLLKGTDGGLYEVRAENELGYVTSKSKVIVMSKCLPFLSSFLLDPGTRLRPPRGRTNPRTTMQRYDVSWRDYNRIRIYLGLEYFFIRCFSFDLRFGEQIHFSNREEGRSPILRSRILGLIKKKMREI